MIDASDFHRNRKAHTQSIAVRLNKSQANRFTVCGSVASGKKWENKYNFQSNVDLSSLTKLKCHVEVKCYAGERADERSSERKPQRNGAIGGGGHIRRRYTPQRLRQIDVTESRSDDAMLARPNVTTDTRE